MLARRKTLFEKPSDKKRKTPVKAKDLFAQKTKAEIWELTMEKMKEMKKTCKEEDVADEKIQWEYDYIMSL